MAKLPAAGTFLTGLNTIAQATQEMKKSLIKVARDNFHNKVRAYRAVFTRAAICVIFAVCQ